MVRSRYLAVSVLTIGSHTELSLSPEQYTRILYACSVARSRLHKRHACCSTLMGIHSLAIQSETVKLVSYDNGCAYDFLISGASSDADGDGAEAAVPAEAGFEQYSRLRWRTVWCHQTPHPLCSLTRLPYPEVYICCHHRHKFA